MPRSRVLAIVAYELPVTRADVRSIRGVDSDGPRRIRTYSYRLVA
jgi:chromosome segregation and condensation protein ScpB